MPVRVPPERARVLVLTGAMLLSLASSSSKPPPASPGWQPLASTPQVEPFRSNGRSGGGPRPGFVSNPSTLAPRPQPAPAAAEPSVFEEAVVQEVNLLRKDPAAYAQFLMARRQYFDGTLYSEPGQTAVRTSEGRPALEEAILELLRTPPRGPLRHARGLWKAARAHANDLGAHGTFGHTGGDGSEPHDRMDRYGRWSGMSGENVMGGPTSPRDVVIGLVVDDGVPSRGHRKNLLLPEWGAIGVGCAPHPQWRAVCVQDFAQGYEDAP